MPTSRGKKWLLGLVILLAAIVAAVFVMSVLPPWLRHREVENDLAAFRANPCQATADPLIDMLVHSRATPEEGEQILRTLIDPVATPKDAYAMGESIVVQVKGGHPLDFGWLWGDGTHWLYIEGCNCKDEGCTDDPETIEFDKMLRRISTISGFCKTFGPIITIERPGTYRGFVRLRYSICEDSVLASFANPPWWKQVLGLMKGNNERTPDPTRYECAFDIPVTIRVVNVRTTTAASGKYVQDIEESPPDKNPATAPATRPGAK